MSKQGQKAIASAITNARKKAFQGGIDITLWLMTIALNESFGFGRKRLLKLQGEFERLFKEYESSIDDDVIYGNAKLKRRINKIMREEVFGK